MDFLKVCEWDKSNSQPGYSDLDVESSVSDLFDFNTPGENDLLLEVSPATNTPYSKMTAI